MGYSFINFPSPSLYPLRGPMGGGEDPRDRKPGPDMRKFWIFIMFILIAVSTMLIAEKIRVNLIKSYNEQQRLHQADTSGRSQRQ